MMVQYLVIGGKKINSIYPSKYIAFASSNRFRGAILIMLFPVFYNINRYIFFEIQFMLLLSFYNWCTKGITSL